MEPEYRKGDLLRVVYERVCVNTDSNGITLNVCVGEETAYIPYKEPSVTITKLAPEFDPDTVWTDRDGMLWLCQYELAEDERDDAELKLISVLGVYSIEDAVDQFSPFYVVKTIRER